MKLTTVTDVLVAVHLAVLLIYVEWLIWACA